MKRFNRLSLHFCRLSPSGVALVMLVWLMAAVMLPNIVFAFTEEYGGWSIAAGVILPLGVYLLPLLFTRRVGVVTLVLLPILALCVVQVVLLYIYGNSIIAVDMFTNIMTTNADESRELLGGVVPIVVTVLLIYLPPIVFALRRFGDERYRLTEQVRKGAVLVGAVLTLVGVQLLYPAARVANDDRIMRSELFPVNVIRNFCIAVENGIAVRRYDKSSANFDHSARRLSPSPEREIYILFIGESSRAASWEMYGYHRSTNPRLSKRDDILLFKNLLTQSNTTHKSVPLMLSSVDAAEYSELFNRKGVADLFRQSGFRTYFLSTQSPQGAMVDNFARECDEVIYIGSPSDDWQLVQMMQRIVESEPEADMFFILHSYGSHYRYNQRYLPHFALFRPDDGGVVNERNIESLRNAYDNSVLYTDYLINQLAEYLCSLEACSAMLYCSDHGEDLFDDGRGMFLHSSPRVTYYQLHIPCLVWLSAKYRESYPTKVALLQQHRWSPASTSAIFHTLADIASIDSPYVDRSKSLSSVEFDESAERLYLGDGNCAECIDSRIGVTILDRREFLLHGIRDI